MGRPRKRPQAPADDENEKSKKKKTRTAPLRTAQNPFEKAQQADEEEEPTYAVEAITSLRFVKGERQYLVKWVGYSEDQSTWEPMENLVGCAEQIREFQQKREEQDKKDLEAALAKREEKKTKREEEEKRLREASIEAAARMEQGGVIELDGNDEEAGDDVMANGNLRMHQGKSGTVWKAFDLTKAKPTCKCLTATGESAIRLFQNMSNPI